MRRLVVLVALVVACGDDTSVTDGGVDGGGDGGTIVVDPPNPSTDPNMPLLTPCAEGFRTSSSDDGFDVCEPWPASGRDETCAAHEAHFPGEAGCVRVGTPCPTDGFPDGVDATAIFVSGGAASGDGSRGAPYGTIAEALAAASPGATIALGVGTYDEAIRYGDGIEIVGACAESTIVVASAPSSSAGVVTAAPGGTSLENVTIGASERPALWGVSAGAQLTVRDVIVDQPKWVGVNLEAGASLDAEGFVVRSVVPGDGGLFGRGLTIERGSTATVTRGVVSGTWEFGVISLGEGTNVTLDRVHVHDSVPRMSDGLAGTGLAATDGGVLIGRSVVVEEATDVGVAVLRSGRVELEDSVIRDTRTHPISLEHGRGLNTESGSTIVARRTLVERNREFGALADGATLELYDVVIRDTSSRELDGRFGRGISIQRGADLIAERLVLVDNREVGLFVGRDGASFDVTDLLVARTVGDEMSNAVGRGVMVQEGAEAIIRRARVEDNHEIGVFVSSSLTNATFEDLVVRRTEPANADNFGRGILVQMNAAATIVRGVVEDSHEVGVFVADAELDVEDVVVRRVLPQACSETTCAGRPGGHGVGVYMGGRFGARRFEIDGADFCGLHVAEGGVATLEDGLIADNAIGVCVQSAAQDLTLLERDTRFEDNGLTLDTTMLPIPGGVAELVVE